MYFMVGGVKTVDQKNTNTKIQYTVHSTQYFYNDKYSFVVKLFALCRLVVIVFLAF